MPSLRDLKSAWVGSGTDLDAAKQAQAQCNADVTAKTATHDANTLAFAAALAQEPDGESTDDKAMPFVKYSTPDGKTVDVGRMSSLDDEVPGSPVTNA